MRALTLFFLLPLVLAACAHGRSSEATAPALRVVEHPELRKLLDDEHVRGTIAILRDDGHEVWCAHATLCATRLTPASTFKIPNALIGLETGVIADAEFVIPWDGVRRDIEAWNRDHTLRTAIAASSVPYFQELARRVGPERMQAWVRRLSYGNMETGSVVDRFWLDGPLAISPVEQLAFLQRFARGELPVSRRTLDIGRDILVLAQHDDRVLRGKTGWAFPHTERQHGWFVGYTERGTQRTYVAVQVSPTDGGDEASFVASRRRIAERALAELGAW